MEVSMEDTWPEFNGLEGLARVLLNHLGRKWAQESFIFHEFSDTILITFDSMTLTHFLLLFWLWYWYRAMSICLYIISKNGFYSFMIEDEE